MEIMEVSAFFFSSPLLGSREESNKVNQKSVLFKVCSSCHKRVSIHIYLFYLPNYPASETMSRTERLVSQSEAGGKALINVYGSP
jgi:hypothetical protein